MSNNLRRENSGILNLFELENISVNISRLKLQIDQISMDESLDSFERKMRIRELNEEKVFLEKKLLKGIDIETPDVSVEIEKKYYKLFERIWLRCNYDFRKDEKY